jgi:hypothetical protein
MKNDVFIKSFNIPDELKHDHSDESINKMREGINLLNLLLGDSAHNKCMDHVVTYAELNIRFLFAANLLSDRSILKEALDMFIENIVKLFLKEKVHE